MMRIYFISFLICILLSCNYIHAQNNQSNIDTNKTIYTEIYLGTQISGIRKEDRVSSNFTPYIQVSLGKQFSPSISLAINYQGPYFNFIGDDLRHKYLYLNGDLVLNVFNLISSKNERRYEIYTDFGGGLFYNNLQKRSSFCFNGALVNSYKLNDDLSIKLKFGGIAGWKIYQHDKDMLLNLSVGITKFIR